MCVPAAFTDLEGNVEGEYRLNGVIHNPNKRLKVSICKDICYMVDIKHHQFVAVVYANPLHIAFILFICFQYFFDIIYYKKTNSEQAITANKTIKKRNSHTCLYDFRT